MKFAAVIEYAEDKAGLKEHHPAHRRYLRGYLENGQLCAAGPFADDAGAMWILDVDNVEVAEEIVRGDPLVEAKVITGWQIRPSHTGQLGKPRVSGDAASCIVSCV